MLRDIAEKVDHFMDELHKKGRITFSEASEMLEVPEEQVESWVKILNDNKNRTGVEIIYTTKGENEVIYKLPLGVAKKQAEITEEIEKLPFRYTKKSEKLSKEIRIPASKISKDSEGIVEPEVIIAPLIIPKKENKAIEPKKIPKKKPKKSPFAYWFTKPKKPQKKVEKLPAETIKKSKNTVELKKLPEKAKKLTKKKLEKPKTNSFKTWIIDLTTPSKKPRKQKKPLKKKSKKVKKLRFKFTKEIKKAKESEKKLAKEIKSLPLKIPKKGKKAAEAKKLPGKKSKTDAFETLFSTKTRKKHTKEKPKKIIKKKPKKSSQEKFLDDLANPENRKMLLKDLDKLEKNMALVRREFSDSPVEKKTEKREKLK